MLLALAVSARTSTAVPTCQVSRVAAVAEDEDEASGRSRRLQQGVERHTGPRGVELRPLRDAVDVHGDRLPGERPELLPRPGLRAADRSLDTEVPALQRRPWRRPGGEHREAPGDVLAGRNAVAFRADPAPPEVAGDDHARGLLASSRRA